ncbi:hypothetical protein TRIUR3_09725 [Triticum urartu]|uniref:Uncharacterized protein n=1 Tax=Triticum urartu TaxID=4572 RepID=M8A699_TRIUA|nr:hypothetical protein TRIUR3_09725 [Triticum urartu]
MGNILKCFRGDEEEDHYPYYHPGSRPHYPQQQQQQQADGHGVASLAHDLLNFESASMETVREGAEWEMLVEKWRRRMVKTGSVVNEKG